MVIEITVHDAEMYAHYVALVEDIITRYGGKYLVRGGQITALAGGWEPERVVVIAFPDREAILRCLSSDEYQELAQWREHSTQSKAIIVDGYTAERQAKDG